MTNTAIRYTLEFKQTLIDLHEKGHSFKELHEEYGLSLERVWVLRTCLVSAESGRIVENRLRSLSCQIIQAIFLERNLR